jgi:hypothetical protein
VNKIATVKAYTTIVFIAKALSSTKRPRELSNSLRVDNNNAEHLLS